MIIQVIEQAKCTPISMSDGTSGKWLIGLLFGLFIAFPCTAAEPGINEGRHRVQLGYTSLDGFDGDIHVLAPAYTYSYSHNLRYSMTTQVLKYDNLQLGEGVSSNDTGLGDTLVSVQYDPDSLLTSSPWIPENLGVFGTLLLPTGDSDEGIGIDAWGAAIGGGLPLVLPSNLMLLPNLAYSRSFHHGRHAVPFEEVSGGLALYWNSPFGAWVGIEPVLIRDMKNNETLDIITIAIGKSFVNGLGFDLHWGQSRRIERRASRDDKILVFNLNWQFGKPPRKT